MTRKKSLLTALVVSVFSWAQSFALYKIYHAIQSVVTYFGVNVDWLANHISQLNMVLTTLIGLAWLQIILGTLVLVTKLWLIIKRASLRETISTVAQVVTSAVTIVISLGMYWITNVYQLPDIGKNVIKLLSGTQSTLTDIGATVALGRTIFTVVAGDMGTILQSIWWVFGLGVALVVIAVIALVVRQGGKYAKK